MNENGQSIGINGFKGVKMLVDSHTHIREAEFTVFKQILCASELKMLVNTMNKTEYDKISEFFKSEIEAKKVYLSFGIHPWDADKIDFTKPEPFGEFTGFYKNVSAIGEIGLDNEWCDVDLEIQKKVFIAQLDIAQKLNKSVVLHTKAREQEIAEIIKNYSVKKLVHWYDDEVYLDEYIKQDCYFTINPDYLINDTIKNIVKRVPLDKLLLETDGIKA